MTMLLSNIQIEFYMFGRELWYRTSDGVNDKFTESSVNMIRFMLDKIETFYPKAYTSLCEEYAKCKNNNSFFRFRVVNRFCRCNLGGIDNVYDVDSTGYINPEYIQCPLLGECKLEHTLCNLEFDSNISPAENRVLELLYKGQEKQNIAESLCLSLHTVNNHIRNAFTRLRIHSKSEFMKWAAERKIYIS